MIVLDRWRRPIQLGVQIELKLRFQSQVWNSTGVVCCTSYVVYYKMYTKLQKQVWYQTLNTGEQDDNSEYRNTCDAMRAAGKLNDLVPGHRAATACYQFITTPAIYLLPTQYKVFSLFLFSDGRLPLKTICFLPGLIRWKSLPTVVWHALA